MVTTCPDLDVAGHEGISANNIHLHHCSLSLRYHDSMWHDISGNRSTQKQSSVTIESSRSVTFSEYANHENFKNLFVPVHCGPLQSSFHRLDSSPIVTWHVIRGEVLDDHQNGSGNTCKETQRSTPQILPHPNKPISIRKSGAHAIICQCYCPTYFFSSIQTSKVQFKSRAWVLKGIGSSGMYRGRPGFPGSYFRKVSTCLDHMGISIHAEGELKLPYGGLTMCFGFLVSDRGQTKTDRLYNLWAIMWYYVVVL